MAKHFEEAKAIIITRTYENIAHLEQEITELKEKLKDMEGALQMHIEHRNWIENDMSKFEAWLKELDIANHIDIIK